MKCSKFKLECDKGEFEVDNMKIDGTKLEAKHTGVKFDASSEIILKTIGTDTWHPNFMPTCVYGPPHGGKGAGIIGLKGS